MVCVRDRSSDIDIVNVEVKVVLTVVLKVLVTLSVDVRSSFERDHEAVTVQVCISLAVTVGEPTVGERDMLPLSVLDMNCDVEKVEESDSDCDTSCDTEFVVPRTVAVSLHDSLFDSAFVVEADCTSVSDGDHGEALRSSDKLDVRLGGTIFVSVIDAISHVTELESDGVGPLAVSVAVAVTERLASSVIESRVVVRSSV